jgi:uncharacterized protein (DUF2235 family)
LLALPQATLALSLCKRGFISEELTNKNIPRPSNRNIILCFDGTTNKFGRDVGAFVTARTVWLIFTIEEAYKRRTYV